ncbi:MAG TPA: cobalamin-independent methionine synthase II family protein [Geminicoccaceae bacterium]|nr:cobalamin-independent methionine synthase II family protein [Geminicoccaceae bacterium]
MLTTTIGAYPKPDYVPIRDWFGMAGGTDTAEPTAGYAETLAAHAATIDEILDRATREVVAEQVDLGIDVPTDGEVRRENFIHYHCRHLVGIDFEALRERRTRADREVLLPTITGPIQAGPTFLVRDWQVAQSATRRPVKLTLPGPLTIGEHVADEHYHDARLRGAALADALNREIRRLAEAGCPVVQIDEPALARDVEAGLAFGIEHLERCFHRVPRSTERVVHVCCGYPDRLDAEDYPKASPSAYLELAPVLDEAEIDAVSLEDAHRPNDLALLERFAGTRVLLGVVAIARSRVEQVEEVRARLAAALDHIDPHRLVAAPDCGLGLLGRDLARRKLRVLSGAAHSL